MSTIKEQKQSMLATIESMMKDSPINLANICGGKYWKAKKYFEAFCEKNGIPEIELKWRSEKPIEKVAFQVGETSIECFNDWHSLRNIQKNLRGFVAHKPSGNEGKLAPASADWKPWRGESCKRNESLVDLYEDHMALDGKTYVPVTFLFKLEKCA